MEDLVTRERAPSGADCASTGTLHVLVTGADGYIGSILGPRLAERGHDVVGLDTGYYRSGWLYNDGKDRPATLTRDVRSLEVEDLEGFDAVVHLAELSNDPLGDYDPAVTYEINHHATVGLARLAKRAGVERFVYASSCSVYGAAGDTVMDEESPTNPQTAYAECKVLVERDVGALVDESFCATFLRNATAFGASPRMRFDLVLNNLAGLAWTTGRIAMTSDGTPWRPIVHIQDISDAIIATLEAPRRTVAGEAFNVGADENVYRIADIAEAIGRAFPECEITFGRNDGDNRSYRVSFEKIRRHLPGFRCRWDVHRGARQLRSLCEQLGFTAEMFAAPPYTRLRELRRLVDSRQLDANLWWRIHDLS